MIFVGRVQREKGVFDVVEIADRLECKYPGRLRYEICGSGSDLEELKRAIEGRGLGEVVKVKGRLERPELLAAYGRSHVLIVPTRSNFCEGMPATAAEGILTGRPVLTSRLSNALDVLEGAVVESQPDDLDSYIEGLERLMLDGDYYRQCCEACHAVGTQFYDRDRGFGAALGRALRTLDAEPVEILPPVSGSGALRGRVGARDGGTSTGRWAWRGGWGSHGTRCGAGSAPAGRRRGVMTRAIT